MNCLKRLNRKGDKLVIHYDDGRGKGQRPATGMFFYTNSRNQTEMSHKSQVIYNFFKP